jgi:pimeloyl-ACP methyl ester carboxylesterase
MPQLHCNNVDIEYDITGDGEPLVLIMGIGAQMILWPDALVRAIADRGYQVIRFDNRDVGRSTWLDHLGVPSIPRMTARAMMGIRVKAPYTLWDMAADTVGLLDGLGHERAHIAGASMGGMVAQCVAIRHPERLLTLTSIMSTTGDRRLFRPAPRAVRALLGRRPNTRAGAEEHFVKFSRAVSGSRFPVDEPKVREVAGQCFDRGNHPVGFHRQWAAILASGNRTRTLSEVETPTLVIHGSEDPLIHPDGGRATAKAIENAQLHMIEGMGHSLPEGMWPEFIDTLCGHLEANPA